MCSLSSGLHPNLGYLRVGRKLCYLYMVSVYLNGRVVPCHSAWLWVSFMTGTFCSVMLLQCAATKSHLGEQKGLRCGFQLILTQHKPIMYGQRNEFCTIHWLTQFMVLSNASIYGLTPSRDCTCYLCVIRCQLSFGSGLHERVICLSLISRSMCVHEYVLWTQEYTLYKPPRAPTPLDKATPPNPQSMCVHVGTAILRYVSFCYSLSISAWSAANCRTALRTHPVYCWPLLMAIWRCIT